ncbi:MAG: EamA family transporter [Fodinibius sp.]|nr:EamA family transporter [Fodinibius sp.]
MAYIYVFLGASLWGIIGIFVDNLSQQGFSALQIVTVRVISASIMLVAFVAAIDVKLLKIDWMDSMSFIGTGIFSTVFFSWAYFTAIEEVSLSVAVILLYTGPAFVVVLSRIFFGEPMTSRKIGALVLTLFGCVLVIKVFPINADRISLYGVLVGLGSGFGYALYSIFGKYALKKYHPLTVISYTFIFASIVMLPTSGFTISPQQLQSQTVWLNILGLGFFPTALAYFLYTMGLSMVESGRASIAATVEPLVATLIGVWLFNEILTIFQIIGMLFILSAVVLVQFKRIGGVRN